MPSLVGLIPAAGQATRLRLGGTSKEVLPVVSESGGERPVIEFLLDAMGAAGIGSAYLVLREGKWDIPQTLARRRAAGWPKLAYALTPGTRSIPETVDVCSPFLSDQDVVLGFPDVRFTPTRALGDLVATRHRSGEDIVLALFPSDRPDKTDMVEIAESRVTGFRVKPGPCDLQHTWILATWGSGFTDFLHQYLERRGDGSGEEQELQMSEVFAAGLASGLSIGAFLVPDGHFLDIGTPGDLERASTRRT